MKNKMFTNRTVIKSLPVVCFLACSLTTSLTYADWSGQQQFRGYNPGYGDFPPENIDQQLFLGQDKEKSAQNIPATNVAPANDAVATTAGSPATSPAASGQYTGQNPNQAAYEEFLRKREQRSLAGNQRYNRQSNFSQPRNNNGSSFSMPWGNNNRGSSFSGPWNNNSSNFNGPGNNRGGNFSGPWNNSGSGFSGPWNNGSRNNNNGGNFNMPWGNNNNGSNFSPWGNGNGGGFSW